MGCGSSKATPIVPTPQRLLLPLPDGDAPESVVSRSVSVGKQLSLVDGKYARCELTLDNGGGGGGGGYGEGEGDGGGRARDQAARE